MGHMAQALAMEETIDHNGKTWKLSPITAEIMAMWESYLENRAWEVLQGRRGKIDPLEYQAKEDRLLGCIAAGDYSFWSEPSLRAQRRLGGPAYKYWIMIRLRAVNNPDDITDALVDEMIEQQAEKLAFALRRMDTPDPNLPTPAANPGAGSESNPSSPG